MLTVSSYAIYTVDNELHTVYVKPYKAMLKISSSSSRGQNERRAFSSSALWCSKSDLRALSTSTSLDTPPDDDACRLTTVILRERSCRATKHSRCSSNNYTHTHTSHPPPGVHAVPVNDTRDLTLLSASSSVPCLSSVSTAFSSSAAQTPAVF